METPETTPDAPARLCATCAAGMERDQDWCLECGTAAPGRLGGLRPGWRAVGTTLALTLVLVGGAGAASYAALSSDANREALATAPPGGGPVAQAPPAVPAPPAPVVPGPAGEDSPTVESDATDLPDTPEATPIDPLDDSSAEITPDDTATDTSADTDAGSGGTGTDDEDESAADDEAAEDEDRGEGTSAEDPEPEPDAKPLKALAITAVSLYDPYGRAQEPGDTAQAFDGDAATAFEVGAPEDDEDMQVGVVIDLGAVKDVGAVEFTTSTPGGRVELYATDSSTIPPEIVDTRWAHPSSRAGVDRKERITLPRGGERYRYVTLWFTTPPDAGARVGLRELKVLG